MITLLVAAPALACGPDFPDLLLVGRSHTLLDLPEAWFLDEAPTLVPRPAEAFEAIEGVDRDTAELRGVDYDVSSRIAAMRLAPNPVAAWSRGNGLPEDVRLYTAGAVAWHQDDHDAAVSAWQGVLALPADQRRLRGAWAAYMLAEAVGAGDPSFPFERVRDEVRAGMADPLGLAVASYGEQARRRLWDGDEAGAVQLYAEQAALGSVGGATSLLFVARGLAGSARWRDLVGDPLVLDLLVLYAWSHPAELGPNTMTADDLLAAAPPGPVRGADRLAALAYATGDYDRASGWASRAASPLGAWVRAKLALRSGDLAAAAAEYDDVVRTLPTDGDVFDGAQGRFTRCRLLEERGTLALARGEYAAALDALVAATEAVAYDPYASTPVAWEDAAYVAERVLTVDELADWVDRRGAVGPYSTAYDRLRALLARRLMREGQFERAFPYFDDRPTLAAARSYADAIARSRGGTRVERARALLEAGWTARPGLYLFGTEGPPDYVAFDGNYARWWDEQAEPEDARWLTVAERARSDASAPRPDARFHYREVAADHAVAAADLLPPTTQAYAMALCQAASYVRDRDPERFQALWRRYVATGPIVSMDFGYACPTPDWDAADERIARDAAQTRRRVAGWAAGAAVVGVGIASLAFVARVIGARRG